MSKPQSTLATDEIKKSLSQISKGNDFYNDASILKGYMVHYVNQSLNAAGDQFTFPAVAIQPTRERSKLNGQKTKSNTTRSFVIVGAVNAFPAEEVTDSLDTLLYDIKRALAFNVLEGRPNDYTHDFDFGEAVFDLPDKNEQYAYFEIPVEYKFIESFE